jgi:Fur family ferric uptake transcriptional regulator
MERNMGKEQTLFKNFLAGQNLKFTPQRCAVLEAVFGIHRHFDADEMVDILKRKQKRISRATVYRTLDLLVKAGLVRAMELGDSKKVYEHIVGHKHHDHLICTACGRTIEFDEHVIESLQQQVCDRLSFRPERHSLRIFGVCDRCQ